MAVQRYWLVIILLVFSCKNKESSTTKILSAPGIDSNTGNKHNSQPLAKLVEFYADSTNVGKKTFNKVELAKYRLADSNYVIIKFFSKQKDSWKLRNEFHFEKDGVADCDTKISDFNNDGFNDMTYVSAVGARGANELRSLFIFDQKNDKLIYIKNSREYPNMLYNKGLNCIDAFLVYGGCSTVFLRIDGDSLKEFADVELFHGLTVTTYDKKGKAKIIMKDSKNKDRDIRYRNYRPLIAYEDQ